MQVDSRDYVFPRASSSSSLEALQEGRSEELMDKEVRAVFLCLFTYLLGDYQNYVTVIRFKPPSFYFNKVSMYASLYNTVQLSAYYIGGVHGHFLQNYMYMVLYLSQ